MAPVLAILARDLTDAVIEPAAAIKESGIGVDAAASLASGSLTSFVTSAGAKYLGYWDDVSVRIAESSNAVSEFARSQEELARSGENIKVMAAQTEALDKAVQQLLGRNQTPLETFFKGIDVADDLLARNLITIEQHGREVRRLDEILGSAADAAEGSGLDIVGAFNDIKTRGLDAIDSLVRSPFGLSGSGIIGSIKDALFGSGVGATAATRGPAALEAGSQAAFQAFEAARGGTSVERETLDAAKKTADTLKRMFGLLKRGVTFARAELGGV